MVLGELLKRHEEIDASVQTLREEQGVVNSKIIEALKANNVALWEEPSYAVVGGAGIYQFTRKTHNGPVYISKLDTRTIA